MAWCDSSDGTKLTMPYVQKNGLGVTLSVRNTQPKILEVLFKGLYSAFLKPLMPTTQSKRK